jgi:hypothetical protein
MDIHTKVTCQTPFHTNVATGCSPLVSISEGGGGPDVYSHSKGRLFLSENVVNYVSPGEYSC